MTAETTPSMSGDSLKGKILIAMPEMADPRFEKSVILMLEHGPEGAMGVMINKPLEAVEFSDLLEQLEITTAEPEHTMQPVFFGGPMEIGRGFLLHSTDLILSHTLDMSPIAVTTSIDMLALMATGKGPKQSLFCLGYTGWTAGQLDEEILENAWLHAPLTADLVFNVATEKRWEAAMEMVGIDPDHLSSVSGHA